MALLAFLVLAVIVWAVVSFALFWLRFAAAATPTIARTFAGQHPVGHSPAVQREAARLRAAQAAAARA